MLASVIKIYFYQILNNIQLASMSASAASLQCPICLHTGVFDSAEALRNRLVLVSTNKLTCPVCQEDIDGLDKLIIHLSSHVKLIECRNSKSEDSTVQGDVLLKQNTSPTHQKKSKSAVTKNKQSTALINTPVKFVKIYPKLPVVSVNNVATLDVTRVANEDSSKTCNSIYISSAPTGGTQVQSATTCNICGLQFIDANILKMHKCLIHNIEDISNQIFTRYNCHLCPKNFKMRGSLMVHLRVAHYGFKSGNSSVESNANSDNTDAEHTNIDKSLSMLKNDNKHWQCDVCRKCFTTKYFLKKHKRLHTGETPYSCTQCNKTFTFQQSYHKHLLYHNDEKPHICSFCGRAFKELSTLHNHQRIHTGEKPFSCETCGKCFRQRVSYLVHRRIHTGVMPYKCTACDKSFRYKVSQRTHKCQAQPPGTVVRQSGDLVEKLKMKHADSNVSVDKVELQEQMEPTAVFLEVSEANAELVRSGAKLSLEDTENENFTLIADAFSDGQKEQSEITDMENENRDNLELLNSNFDDFIDVLPEDKSVPSPSDILKKLCLSQEEDLTRSEQSNNEFVSYEMYHGFM